MKLIRISIFALLVGVFLFPAIVSATPCCVCNGWPRGEMTQAQCDAYNKAASWGGTCIMAEHEFCEPISGPTTGDTCCVCPNQRIFQSSRDKGSCDKHSEYYLRYYKSACALKEDSACAYPAAVFAPEPEPVKVDNFKFGDILPAVKIPDLRFSAPPTVADAEGNIYISWIGEYLKAVYNFSIIAISILGVIVLILQGVKIITSAGGPAKGEAYKRIAQIVIGLAIAWGSYVIMFSINKNLTVFKPLQIQFIETIPAITLIEQPVESLPTDAPSPRVTGGGAPAKIPDYKQFSKQWADMPFGYLRACDCGTKAAPGPDRDLCTNGKKNNICCTSIQAAGCGPTSLAMVLSAYGATGATPDKVAAFVGATPDNGRVCNAGTSLNLAVNQLKSSPWPDFKGQSVTKDQALKLLAEKKPVIILCINCGGMTKKGPTTWGGHYMVLTSVDELGNVGVNDPGGNANTGIYTMTTGQLDKNGGFWYVYR